MSDNVMVTKGALCFSILHATMSQFRSWKNDIIRSWTRSHRPTIHLSPHGPPSPSYVANNYLFTTESYMFDVDSFFVFSTRTLRSEFDQHILQALRRLAPQINSVIGEMATGLAIILGPSLLREWEESAAHEIVPEARLLNLTGLFWNASSRIDLAFTLCDTILKELGVIPSNVFSGNELTRDSELEPHIMDLWREAISLVLTAKTFLSLVYRELMGRNLFPTRRHY